MPKGRKPSETEKAIIVQRLRDGVPTDAIRNEFPEVDGRCISGQAMAGNLLKSAGIRKDTGFIPVQDSGIAGAPAAVMEASPASTSLPIPVAEVPVVPVPAPLVAPRPAAQVPTSPSATGFTTAAASAPVSAGFTPSTAEVFLVKRLDGTAAGLVSEERPPFNSLELYRRFPPGNYQIQHFLNGKHYQTYMEMVPARVVQGQSPGGIVVDRPAVDPAAAILSAVRTAHDIHAEARREALAETAGSNAARAQIESARESGNANVAAAAIAQMGSVMARGDGGAMEKMISLQSEERKTIAARASSDLEIERVRSQNEMNRIREQSRLDFERDKARLDAEVSMRKRELDESRAREQAFTLRLKELDDQRNKMIQEGLERQAADREKMIAEVIVMRDSIREEIDERRKHADEISSLQLKFTSDIIDLKKSLSGDNLELKKIEVVTGAIDKGLDRLGQRFDAAAEAGLFGSKVPLKKPAQLGMDAPSGNGANGGSEMSQKEMLRDAFAQTWFSDLQDEVSRVVALRISRTPGPWQGAVMAEQYIDDTNAELRSNPPVTRMKKFMHYLCTRTWTGILEDAKDSIKTANSSVLRNEEAGKWFDEFQSFLRLSWDSSWKAAMAAREAASQTNAPPKA